MLSTATALRCFASLTPAVVVSILPLLLNLVLISVGICVPTTSG